MRERIERAMMEWVRLNHGHSADASASPRKLHIDSLALIELVMHLEEECAIEIPDDWLVEGLEDKSFSELATLLSNKLEE